MVRNGPHQTYPLSLPDFQEDVEDYIRRGPHPEPQKLVSSVPPAQIAGTAGEGDVNAS
jgi:hypothetical protein